MHWHGPYSSSLVLTVGDFSNWVHVSEEELSTVRFALGYPLNNRPVILTTLSFDVKGRGPSIHGTVRVSLAAVPRQWEFVHASNGDASRVDSNSLA